MFWLYSFKRPPLHLGAVCPTPPLDPPPLTLMCSSHRSSRSTELSYMEHRWDRSGQARIVITQWRGWWARAAPRMALLCVFQTYTCIDSPVLDVLLRKTQFLMCQVVYICCVDVKQYGSYMFLFKWTKLVL